MLQERNLKLSRAAIEEHVDRRRDEAVAEALQQLKACGPSLADAEQCPFIESALLDRHRSP